MKKLMLFFLIMFGTLLGNAQWPTTTFIMSEQPGPAGQPSKPRQEASTTQTSRAVGYKLTSDGFVDSKYSLKVSLIIKGNQETYRVKEYKELGSDYAIWMNCTQDAYETANNPSVSEVARENFSYYIEVLEGTVYFNP